MFPEAAQLFLPTSLLTAALGVRLFLACVFVLAARHKLHNRLEFEGIVTQYKLAPPSASAALSLMIPLCELSAAAALLLVPSVGAGIAAVLLFVYAGGMALNLFRGRQHIDCGCGGDATPLSSALVGRNLLMILLAALVGFAETSPLTSSESGMDVATTVLALAFAAGLGAVYISFNQLQVNAGIHRRLWLQERVG